MAHWVCRKNKYWSLEESYRNAEGKPRKRVLRYLGIPPIDWAYTLRGDGAVFNPPQTPPSVPGQETPAQTSGEPSPASAVEQQTPTSQEPSLGQAVEHEGGVDKEVGGEQDEGSGGVVDEGHG